ncbi:MAG: hypothetical protein GX442_09325 [Candidatus Riflebacteria bacterium]|nr:hypothetical protein [Candidatus Riflebacteria bacterium]
MPIDEIEVPGSSISFKVWKFQADSIAKTYQRLKKEGDTFDLATETPGFSDCDGNDRVIRGYYAAVIPFEVEHLVDGIMTKEAMKRIEHCEFLAVDGYLFTTGKAAPQKPLSHSLSLLTGYGVTLLEFEFHQLSQFHDRLSQLKSIVLTNPKDREIRRARLTGHIESYTEYNVIDPRNHGIDNVAGIVDSPLGPMTLTVSRRGGLRLGVRKGFILTLDCLQWIMQLILADKPPEHVQKRS